MTIPKKGNNGHEEENKPNILDNSLDQAPKTGERYQKELDTIQEDLVGAMDRYDFEKGDIQYFLDNIDRKDLYRRIRKLHIRNKYKKDLSSAFTIDEIKSEYIHKKWDFSICRDIPRKDLSYKEELLYNKLFYIAHNENTPSEILNGVLIDIINRGKKGHVLPRLPYVLCETLLEILLHPNTDPLLIEENMGFIIKLNNSRYRVGDPKYLFLQFIATRPDLTSKTLVELFENYANYRQYMFGGAAIYYNPNTPQSIKKQLLDDKGFRLDMEMFKSQENSRRWGLGRNVNPKNKSLPL